MRITLWQFCLISASEFMAAGDVELNCLRVEIVDVALKALLPTLFAKNDILDNDSYG